MNTREELIDHLKNHSDVLRSESLERAFCHVDRADFVLGDYEPEAYEDYPLPILSGQTISQPTTVAFMLELLDPQADEKILDIGSGSAWTTALLAHMVGSGGDVLGLEIDEELLGFGKDNLRKYNFPQAQLQKSDFSNIPDGYFDKVLVSAAMNRIPEEITKSLLEDGLMVAPIDGAVTLLRKQGESLLEIKSFPGFEFVPFNYGDIQ